VTEGKIAFRAGFYCSIQSAFNPNLFLLRLTHTYSHVSHVNQSFQGYHSTKEKQPGFEDGLLPTTYYYATLDKKTIMHEYSSIRSGFFNREYPSSWYVQCLHSHGTVDFYTNLFVDPSVQTTFELTLILLLMYVPFLNQILGEGSTKELQSWQSCRRSKCEKWTRRILTKRKRQGPTPKINNSYVHILQIKQIRFSRFSSLLVKLAIARSGATQQGEIVPGSCRRLDGEELRHLRRFLYPLDRRCRQC
jgi:hypothetical protein